MDAAGSCMRECNFANVRLPLEIGDGDGRIELSRAAGLTDWIKETGVAESGYYFQTCLYAGALWWRLSGMVYVDVEDFRRGAVALRALCERARRGEYLL